MNVFEAGNAGLINGTLKSAFKIIFENDAHIYAQLRVPMEKYTSLPLTIILTRFGIERFLHVFTAVILWFGWLFKERTGVPWFIGTQLTRYRSTFCSFERKKVSTRS